MQRFFLSCSINSHFERAEGESRNLFLNRFLHFASLRDASVEMTESLFYRASSALNFTFPFKESKDGKENQHVSAGLVGLYHAR